METTEGNGDGEKTAAGLGKFHIIFLSDVNLLGVHVKSPLDKDM